MPEEEQPGIHVRGREERPLTDEEMIEKIISLVKKYGPVRARYKNAVCLILNENIRKEAETQDLWGEPFLFVEKPHTRRVPGFPLDSISVEIESGRYFYDMEDGKQDVVAADTGFQKFFEDALILPNFS